MDRPQKGVVVTVNNLDEETEMEATKRDVSNISGTFNKLGFKVETPQKNLLQCEMSDLIRTLEREDYSEFNIFVLFIISHGIAGDLIICKDSPKDEYGKFIDKKAFEVGEFVQSLSRNESLNGIPKLLFFECCRGTNINYFTTKSATKARPATNGTSFPLGSDIFIGFSTVSGFTSSTNRESSPFIHHLLQVVREKYEKESLINIFQATQARMSSGPLSRVQDGWTMQMAEMRSTLRTQLYFNQTGNSLKSCNL